MREVVEQIQFPERGSATRSSFARLDRVKFARAFAFAAVLRLKEPRSGARSRKAGSLQRAKMGGGRNLYARMETIRRV